MQTPEHGERIEMRIQSEEFGERGGEGIQSLNTQINYVCTVQ